MHFTSTARERFTVTGIGTCRIDGPLRVGAQKRGYQRIMSRVYGYSHAISEVVQQVRYLHGDYQPDRALWHIIAQRDFQKVDTEVFKPADFNLIEISSRKQLSVDGHSVQINHLKAACAPFFDDDARKSRFWHALRERDTVSQRSMIADFGDKFTLSGDQKHVLSRLRLTETTDEELARGLAFVGDALGQILVVTHVNAVRRCGRLIKNRDICVSQVERVATEAGFAVFNPTMLMHKIGQDRAIEDESESFAHFTDEFSEQLFCAWQSEHLDRMINDRFAVSTSRSDLRKLESHLSARLTFDGVKKMMPRVNALTPRVELTADFEIIRMRLMFNANLVPDAQTLAAAVVKNGTIDRNLFFHATRHAYTRKDAELLWHCLSLVCSKGLANENPWLDEALEWLAMLDPRSAIVAYLSLFAEYPNQIGTYAERFRDLVLAHPHLMPRDEVSTLVTALTSRRIHPSISADLAIALGVDALAILCEMMTQSSERFMAAYCVLAKRDMANATQAVQAVLLATAQTAQQCDARVQAMLKQCQVVSDPARRHVLLRDVLAWQPENLKAVSLMADLTENCRQAGRAAYQQRDLERLKSMLLQAGRHLPKVDEIPYFISRIHYERGLYAKALDMANLAVSWGPNRARNWSVLLRPAVKLRRHEIAEEAASAMIRFAARDEQKLVAEAEKRLSWAREKLWARALVVENANDALAIANRIASAPELANRVEHDLPIMMNELCVQFARHLTFGEVSEAIAILRGIAPIYAAFPSCCGIVFETARRVRSLALLQPLLQQLAMPTDGNLADDFAVRAFGAALLNSIKTNQVTGLG
ncbi:hypothetical protein [Cognatiyoonia sp. IB215182]|uniref:hypothetical protein n=1 Tax=Cognatiyoonia sp. IB215182 TaxID=3097353 RepID=UPI002A1686F7|nr:hypothetical protein [Cognatiyoonia sp. IB215182]MDX8354315.1 hypothetical protein [Cognatiyoonia sp. IB215182]